MSRYVIIGNNLRPVVRRSRPVDASGVQTGRDSAAGKDFNTDLGAGLDSLNNLLLKNVLA